MHIVDAEQVHLAVVPPERIDLLRLDRRDELVGEGLGRGVAHRRRRPAFLEAGGDGVQQVRLAQAARAVQEERRGRPILVGHAAWPRRGASLLLLPTMKVSSRKRVWSLMAGRGRATARAGAAGVGEDWRVPCSKPARSTRKRTSTVPSPAARRRCSPNCLLSIWAFRLVTTVTSSTPSLSDSFACPLKYRW